MSTNDGLLLSQVSHNFPKMYHLEYKPFIYIFQAESINSFIATETLSVRKKRTYQWG